VEIISENPVVILDVAHNPPAMRYLASMLRQRGDGVRYAVIGMLKDKDIYSSLCELKGIFDRIFVCSLPGERGSTAEHVKDNLLRTGMAPEKVETFDTAYEAYVRAVSLLPEGAELVVCGSFVTAEELLRKLNANQEF
jgi:dihydrofolate synthase/folylpolyglutamate synthase